MIIKTTEKLREVDSLYRHIEAFVPTSGIRETHAGCC